MSPTSILAICFLTPALAALAVLAAGAHICAAQVTKTNKSFIDYSLPSPIVSALTANILGVAAVGPRAPKNVLEDATMNRWKDGHVAATTFAETPKWQAQWIGATTNHAENTWSVFRKRFTLRTVPKSAMARIAVDSKYWLWINGKQVVFEGGLKRGPNPRDTYYDEVDLAPWLRKGDNIIAVLTWFWGKEGFSHKNSGKAGFLFELNAGNVVVVSDASWKALVHPAYGTPAGEKPNFRLPECNIRFDARNDLGDWTSAKFNDSAWPPALQFGAAGVAPWNKLHPRPIPQWKNYGLKDYLNLNVSLPLTSTGQVIVAKLPYNAQVTPWLRVEAAAGQTIDIRSSNYRGGGEPNIRAEYVTRDGIQEYESLGWFNGQDVLYKIPPGVKVLGLKYRETGYNTEFSGAFTSDDPFCNRLWQKAVRTLYVTMRDNFMDCPDRERAQWWGDVVNQLGQAFYSLSPSSGKLVRKAIYELCGWQKPDKTLYSPIPSTAWTKELPQQMLASISQYGFWTHYLHTGDKQTVVDAYPHVRDYLSIWKLDEQGLVAHRDGDWNWADWGDNTDERVLDQAWYCLALQGAANMARLAGKPDEAMQYETIRSNVIAAVNKNMWNGLAYRTPTYKGATDDRANALCVVAGIADSEKFPAIKKILATEYHASPYMEKYVLEALMLMDDPDAALARMKKRYGAIVADEWTTLPELWVAGTALTGQLTSTHNHAWAGGPLTILSQYFAGLAPLTQAWATYQVRPQMGPLKKIDATVHTVAGKISVRLRRAEHVFSLTLNSPKGTTAQVYLPYGHTPPQRVKANGRLIRKIDQATGNVRGVVFKGTTNGWMHFEVTPGDWKIELTTPNQSDAATKHGQMKRSSDSRPVADSLWIPNGRLAKLHHPHAEMTFATAGTFRIKWENHCPIHGNVDAMITKNMKLEVLGLAGSFAFSMNAPAADLRPSTEPKSFISYFLPASIVGSLTASFRGVAMEGPRDPKSGLEDATCSPLQTCLSNNQ